MCKTFIPVCVYQPLDLILTQNSYPGTPVLSWVLLVSQLTLHSGLRVQTQDSARQRNCCDNEPIAGHFPDVLANVFMLQPDRFTLRIS